MIGLVSATTIAVSQLVPYTFDDASVVRVDLAPLVYFSLGVFR